MAYAPDYTSDDLSPAMIDGLLKVAVGLIAFTGLIGILIAVVIIRRLWAGKKVF